jgi:hypothetical protein
VLQIHKRLSNLSKPLRGLGLAVGLAVTGLSLGQEDAVLELDDNLSFDGDFSFDDDLFGSDFEFEESESQSSILDDFTFRLTQQIYGQINSHSVEPVPGFSFRRESQLENNRLGINIRYQNPFATGWLLQVSAQSRIYLKNDYQYKANGDNLEIETRINELFVQRSFGQHSIKLGRQTVVWGETLGNSVLDIINTSEFRDLSIIDIEDARRNQFMLAWDYFGDGSTVSSFINLFPEFNPAPVRGSPFFFEPEFNLTDYRREGDMLIEVGSQWRKSFEGSDIAIMAAYLFENQLRFEDPINSIGNSIAEKNDFFLLGFSANRAIGKLLLNFDFAFSHGITADSFNFPGTNNIGQAIDLKKDQIGTSLGFEYAVSNDQSVSLGIQAQTLINEDEGLLPGQSLINDGVFGSWLVRYSNTLKNGDLVFSATFQGDLNAESLLALVGLDYTISDNWAINAQIISINATAGSPLLFFDEDLRLGTTLSYSF